MLVGSKPLNIGQGASCDFLLPDSQQFEPLIYATILKCEDEGNWFLVKRTDCFHILINDKEISIASELHHDDMITFSDGEAKNILKFEVFHDGHLDTNSGFIYKKNQRPTHYVPSVLAIVVMLVFCIISFVLSFQQIDLRNVHLSPFCQSIYHITTDSVYLLSGIDTIECIELEKAAEGTAFLTNDTLFVTARHCIEPWLNDEEWDGISSKNKMSPEVRLATFAETENRMAGYEKYTIMSHCVISKGLERYDYYSTDFFLNKGRDLVLKLGTPQETIYWRTIFPLASRRNMELGDFAYLKADKLGKNTPKNLIPTASWDEITKLMKYGNHDIAILGYPLNDNGVETVSMVKGNLTDLEFNDTLNSPEGCLRLSIDINRGNSGGPVFAVIDNTIKAIGIVSKADRLADQAMFWAVPITEVSNMHKNNDQTKKDTETYRR